MIAFRASSSAGVVVTLQLNVLIPAAVQVGDLMILAAVINQPLTIDIPSGWVEVRVDQSVAAPLIRQYIYYRIATAGDVGGATTVPVIPTTGSNWCGATLTAWSGAEAIDTHDSNEAAAAGTSITAPSITTSVPDTLTIQVYAWANGTATISVPTTFRVTPPTDSSEFDQVQASQAAPTAGATGTKVATASTNVAWVAAHLALMPATVPGGWGVGMVRMGAN